MRLVSMFWNVEKTEVTVVAEQRHLLVLKRRRIFTANDSVGDTWNWIERCTCGKCGLVMAVDLETSLQLDRWMLHPSYRKLWNKSRGAARGIVWPEPPPNRLERH